MEAIYEDGKLVLPRPGLATRQALAEDVGFTATAASRKPRALASKSANDYTFGV